MDAWIWWLAIAILLFIIELLTGTAACLCIAGGCLVGMIVALAGFSAWWQVGFAVAAAIAMLITVGPAIRKVYARHASDKKYATGMDALIGRIGTVTHEVSSVHENKGRVQIDGDNWQAYTDSQQQPIPRGAKVIVESYDSIILKVKPLEDKR